MLNTKLIIASTRPGRKGPAIADWIYAVAKAHGEMDVEVLDLAAINLPMMDEPNHPRLQQYTKQHTKDWSAKIDSAEAFIIVMPEYNFGFTAPLKNALDYVFQEWQNKPVALVSYGGASGGMRAVQLLKPVLQALTLVAIPEAVSIAMFAQYINAEGVFTPNEPLTKSAEAMMNGLVKWGEVMKGLRK